MLSSLGGDAATTSAPAIAYLVKDAPLQHACAGYRSLRANLPLTWLPTEET